MVDTLPLPGSDRHLDAAVAFLHALNRSTFLSYAIEAGEFLVRHFYDGNYAAIHARNGEVHRSFEALLQHRGADLTELDLTPRTLRNYMAAAEVWHSLPETTRSKLGLRHLQQLATVTDPVQRKGLAHDAAALKWTTEQVAAAVSQAKKEQRAGKKKPGRKRKPAALKAAVAMQASVRRLMKLGGAAAKLDDGGRDAFRKQVKQAIAALKSLLSDA